MDLDHSQIAWAAGLFEGEGSVSQVKRGELRPRCRAAVYSTDRWVVDKFAEAVGMGKVYGPYQRKGTNWKPNYTWLADGYESVSALRELIGPHLSPRRIEQFDRAMEVGASPERWSRRRAVA